MWSTLGLYLVPISIRTSQEAAKYQHRAAEQLRGIVFWKSWMGGGSSGRGWWGAMYSWRCGDVYIFEIDLREKLIHPFEG